jgi:hypothetical protein
MSPRLTATLAIALAAAAVAAPSARAGLISWTDWTSLTLGDNGSASGTVLNGSVAVTYSGQLLSPSQTDTGATNYWNPDAPYLSPTIDNAPGDNGILTLSGGAQITQTITFSSPVTDPVMAVVSIGAANDPVHYVFDTPFTLLSTAPGYWGGASTNLFQQDAYTLLGVEGHGAIQFEGTYTSISFTVPEYEYWHGFTVGVPAAVPEPAAMSAAPLALLALRRRR